MDKKKLLLFVKRYWLRGILACLALYVISGAVFYEDTGKGVIIDRFPVPVCPDDYPDNDAGSDAYLADTNRWTNEYFDANPGSDMGGWAQARKQFWVDNDCTEALQRYEESKAGEPDPATVETVRDSLQ